MKTRKIILGIILPAISLAGCQDSYTSPESGLQTDSAGTIDASCFFSGLSGAGDQDASVLTKAPVGQTTTVALSANFLKWDEPYQEENEVYAGPGNYVPFDEDVTPVDWEGAVIVDASISSPQDNRGCYFRSINMDPRQTYRTTGSDDTKVGYISRMVGWYPATYDVPEDFTGEGNSNAIYKDADGFYRDDHGVYVCFENLDLKTDIMVSDVREGRVKLSNFKNNSSDREVSPFGHEFSNPLDYLSDLVYDNHFSFKHYLSAIRLYVTAEESVKNLISWGQIEDVVFVDQPTSVRVRLPDKISGIQSDSPTVFGEASGWDDLKDMSIVKEPMFEDDPDHPEYGTVPDYPVALEDAIAMSGNFLGYALVRPGGSVKVELHTDAGVFNMDINAASLKNEDGSAFGEKEFKAGYIYNVYIDIRADGSMDTVLGNADFMSFENLAPYNENLKDYEYSNCYVIPLEDLAGKDSQGGFYFYAGCPGRGKSGMLSGRNLYPESAVLEPYSVQILWQSEEYLIRHAELLHGYVRFVLNERCYDFSDQLDGNAVLAAYDREGNVLWSWHIWVVNGLKDVTFRNVGGITMMNMNLGATKAGWTSASDVLETYGLYYQWGRKDPSPGPESYDYGIMDMITAPYITNSGTQTSVLEGVYSQPTVEDGARHPLVVVGATSTDTYPNDWLYYKVDNLWGYDTSSGAVTKKTIYDPCPYGYRVADDELREVFDHYKGNSRGSQYEKQFGHIYDNVYFPFAGWKGHDQGRTDRTHAWFGVGTHGDYQSARINSGSDSQYDKDHRERNLILAESLFGGITVDNIWYQHGYSVLNVKPVYTDNITLDWTNRTTAAPVRCVKYDGEPAMPEN